MQKTTKIVLLLVMILLTLSACSDRENAPEDIVIGLAYPVKEMDGTTGYIKGIQMAVNEINMGNGIKGRKIKLSIKDDEGSVTVGTSVAQSFVQDPDLVAVIGHWNSRVSLAASGIYEKAGILMITAASSNPELTNRGYQYILSHMPDDREIARVMVEYAAKQGYKRGAIYYADDSYGRGLANAIEDHAKVNGLEIIDRVTEFEGDQYFESLANRWQAFENEVFFVADVMPNGGRFIDKVRSYDPQVPIIGATGLDRSNFIQVLGKKADQVVIPSLFNPDSINEKTRTFVNRFNQGYGQDPDFWAVQGYEVVKLLSYAMERAESIGPANIVAELYKIDHWEGITGDLYFTETGQIEGKTFSKKIVNNGRFEYIIE